MLRTAETDNWEMNDSKQAHQQIPLVIEFRATLVKLKFKTA
jgi:hypothetical protein